MDPRVQAGVVLKVFRVLLASWALLLAGGAGAGPEGALGLRTTDASGCRLSDGRGFESPTIVLMTGAYNHPSLDPAVALQIIDVALQAGCDFDAPDDQGLSPLNAAILYNEPVLVERFLRAGADPYKKISSPRERLDGLDSFEFLQLLETKAPGQKREAVRAVLTQHRR